MAWPHRPFKPSLSLSRQLTIWVVVPQVVLWIAGGFSAYRLATSYVDQALDNGLLLSSRALARQLKPLGNGLLIDFPRAAQSILEADPNDRQFYMVSSPPGQFVLGNQTLPPPPIDLLAQLQPDQPYFYDGTMPSGEADQPQQRVRAVALYFDLDGEFNAAPQQVLVQIARSNNTREQLIQRILLDMLLPMSSLVLLMTLIVWLGVRTGLAPLKRLTQQVEGRKAHDLHPIELESAPKELHTLSLALNSLLLDTQHLLQSQKRFIGDAAHQLRTPLAGLKSQTELALHQSTDPDLRARLQRVHEGATRSAHLVNQLLTLARAEPDAMLASMIPINLHHFLKATVTEWVPKALKAHIDLGFETHDAAHAFVMGEPTLLKECLNNLIDNALQYAGAGAEVTVGLDVDAAQARVWVQDNGPGVPESMLAQVFDRFVRATDRGNGCGLGLAIVRDIVERHGGQVDVRNTGAKGFQVTLHMPLAPHSRALNPAQP